MSFCRVTTLLKMYFFSSWVLLILICIYTANAALRVDLMINKDAENESRVSHSGEERYWLSDEEAVQWNLFPPDRCNETAEKLFGRKADGCWIHEPTTFKLYPTYNWTEVISIHELIDSRIIAHSKKRVHTYVHTYKNKHPDISIDVNLGYTTTVTDKVSIKSCAEMAMANNILCDAVEAKISLLVHGIGVGLEYNHTIGKEDAVTQSRRLSIASDMTVKLPPNSTLKCNYHVYEGKCQVVVRTRNRLNGHMAANFNPTLNGRYFWAMSLGSNIGEHIKEETFEINYAIGGFMETTAFDGNGVQYDAPVKQKKILGN